MNYRYRTDEEMKDSGVEWLEKIPKDWRLLKLKRITHSVKNGIWGDDEQHNSDDIPCIRILNFDRNKMQIDTNDLTLRNIPKEKQKNYLLNKGDLLIEKSGGGEKNPVGFVAIYNHIVPSVYANFIAKISLNDNANSNYVRYLCSDIYNKRVHMDSVNQTTGIQNLDTERYFSRVITLPDIKEQEKIANFLDEKTSKFDLIISKKEELIKKLEEAKKSLISEVVTGKVKVVKTDDGYKLVKRNSDEMNYSGVEWLGEIPKDWEVRKLTQLAELTRLAGAEYTSYWKTDDEGEIIALRGQNIGENELYLNNTERISMELSNKLKRSKLYKGDIVFPCVGTIGKATLINEDNKYHINQNIAKVTYNCNITPELLSYLLNSNECHKQITWFNSSQMQPSVLIRDLRQFKFAISPNKLEQIQVSKFLDLKLKSIAYLLSNNKLQIEKLKEAKQSLISEAVTGKIEILD